jgi:23S rRNA (cytosine1962-C5)-methyltransferase
VSLPVIAFHPGKEKRLSQGYLWAFRNELNFKEKDFGPGSLVAVQSSKGRPLGVGFLNTQSSLCFRLLGTARDAGDEASAMELLKARLASAVNARSPRQARRLVFSEGDLLSGLVVDQYNEVLVVQITSWGLEQRKELIFETLKALTGCKAIIQRSESGAREKEGLVPATGVLWTDGSISEAKLFKYPILEAGMKFELDLLQGQKTGFFLDQRDTREALQRISKGKRCLDVFCHSGALSLALAKGEATSVLGIDESEAALSLATRNAKLNKLKVEFEEADAFKWLRAAVEKGETYDLVVLDPPAMTKGQQGLGDALRGYKELNLRAIKLLVPGGLLVSCSCTQAVKEADFLSTIQSAAVDAGARLQELIRLGQPEDHPRHPAMAETRYLKIFVFRKF